MLQGRVSSAVLGEVPGGASFVMLSEGTPTLSERHLADLMAAEMRTRGFVEAPDPSVAQLAVAYFFTLGPGTVSVGTRPNSATGGRDAYSYTSYPRFLQVWLLDWKASEAKQEPVVLWQGELYSAGAGGDLSALADYFVPEVFSRFGRGSTNETFTRVITVNPLTGH